jgi:response regulator RpfG family c-di-GMP phosphodiesterase
MQARLMIVDDEPEVLKALQRFLKRHFEIHMFPDAQSALNFLQHTHCHLILSDMRLPHMSGAEFLEKASKISPTSKKIVLTGHADISEAKAVVNNANISRYFTKPWQNKELLAGLSELVSLYNEEHKHKKAISSLKGKNSQLNFTKKVMNNAIQGMLDEKLETSQQNESLSEFNEELICFSARLINLLVEDDTGHNYRIAQQAKLIAKSLSLSEQEQEDIYLAGLYYSIGMVGLSKQLKQLVMSQMTYTQKKEWFSLVEMSADILDDIHLLKPAAHIVKHIFERIDGSGKPNNLLDNDIPIGSKILSVVIHYDRILMGKVYQYTPTLDEAFIQTKSLVGKAFSAKVFNHFVALHEEPSVDEFEYATSPDNMIEGMIASQDLFNHNNQRLIAKDVVITESMITALKHYQVIKESPIIAYVKSQTEPKVQCEHEE